MLVLTVITVIFSIMFPSCQKEESQISPDRIQQIRNEMSKAKYLPTEQVLKFYGEKKNAGNLKDAVIVKPTVAFSAPDNDLEVYLDGSFNKVWVWTMTQGGSLVDNGIIAITYNQNYEQIGDPEFYIGWENEYCTPVSIVSNFENAQTLISFSFPTTTGTLSFDTYTDCQNYMELWLPQLNFDCSWETVGGAMFGGTMSFNPAQQTEVSITINGLSSNITDYVKFDTRGFNSNTKVIINISDSDGNWSSQITLNFPSGKTIPTFVMLPITFVPNQIFYQTVTYPNGIAEYSDYVIQNCYLFSEEDGIKIWKLNAE